MMTINRFNTYTQGIVHQVASLYCVSVQELTGRSRTAHIAAARHVLVFLIASSTRLSLEKIGMLLNRDHTTIMNSLRWIDSQLAAKTHIAEQIEYLIRTNKAAPWTAHRCARIADIIGNRQQPEPHRCAVCDRMTIDSVVDAVTAERFCTICMPPGKTGRQRLTELGEIRDAHQTQPRGDRRHAEPRPATTTAASDAIRQRTEKAIETLARLAERPPERAPAA